MLNYFDTFNLKTKKYNSYMLWKHIHNNIGIKKHLQKEELPFLIEKAKKINNIYKNISSSSI